MKRALLPLLLGLAGCAPVPAAGPAGVADARGGEVRGEVNNGVGYEFVLAREGAAHAVTLPAPAEATWGALLEAYAALEMPVTDVDTGARQLGSRGLTLRARLGDQPLSRFLDCGRIVGGQIANRYQVHLSVVSALEPVAGGETRLATRVAATASDPGSSSTGVRCLTTGELEKRIAAMTAVRLGR